MKAQTKSYNCKGCGVSLSKPFMRGDDPYCVLCVPDPIVAPEPPDEEER